MIVAGGPMARKVLCWLFFLGTGTLGAAPVVSLASLEGEVRVQRAGLVIPSERIAEGFLLEAFDLVTTGTTGRTDLRIPPALGVSATVVLDPGSNVYLDLSDPSSTPETAVEFLSGSVSVRVGPARGGATLSVRTGQGVYSTTQAQFRVVSSPVGDILVTVDSGKVQCRFPGRTVFAEPGTVVEALALDGSVGTTVINGSTQASFETAWLVQRQRTTQDQGAVYFRALASRYQLQAARFQRAWERYGRESKDGPKAVGAAVANLRRASWPLERSVLQVGAVKKLLQGGFLAPTVELTRGYLAGDFFRQESLDEPVLTSRLGEVRGLFRTAGFSLGVGNPPSSGEVGAITFGSAFFH